MSVAVILGASHNRAKFGNKSVRAHRAAGFDVIPVNPRGGEIEELPTYTSLEEIPPQPIQRVSVYLPPARLLPLLPAIAQLQCEQLWLNPGTESPEVLDKCQELGIQAVQGCSIIDVGYSPSDFPDTPDS